MNDDWRNSRDYRVWRAGVIRLNPRCAICGSLVGRQAHHLNDATHYPELRYDVENGVTLCRRHHTMFHTSYKNSFRDECTKKDFLNFCEMYYAVKKEVTDNIIAGIKRTSQ